MIRLAKEGWGEPFACHPEPFACHPEPLACHPERSEGSSSWLRVNSAKDLNSTLRAGSAKDLPIFSEFGRETTGKNYRERGEFTWIIDSDSTNFEHEPSGELFQTLGNPDFDD